MAFSKAALKTIQDAKPGRESVKAVLAVLADDQTITQDVAARVSLALDAHPELDNAIRADKPEKAHK
jgi:hypothetical protein